MSEKSAAESYGCLKVTKQVRGKMIGYGRLQVDGQKRIEFIQKYAQEHCISEYAAIRQILNRWIDAAIDASAEEPEFDNEITSNLIRKEFK